jgi:hypothetical protein
VSTGGPDLFVVCKNCGSEVSPYITECPYCGNRLRKRAPKIDRDGRVTEKRRRRIRRPPTPSLSRLRHGEIPGIRAETRPYAAIVLVLTGIVGCVLWRTGLIGLQHLVVFEKPGAHSWRLVTAAFTYNNIGYAFACLGAIALYGWLVERRHGPVVVLLLFLAGAVGGLAVTSAVYPHPLALGGNGGAMALLVAWAVPDVMSLRAGEEIEGDLLGTAVIAGVIALMPLAAPLASWVSGGVGAAVGVLAGVPLARLSRV